MIACVIAMLVFTVSGCGGGTSQQGKLPSAYKFGIVYPLTGNAAEHGRDQKEGIDFAVKEINAAGGIGGVQLTPIYEDGRALPKDTVSAVNKLITVDKVPVIFIGWSSPTLASAPIADANKTLLINSAAVSPRLYKAGQFLFNLCNLQSYEVDVLCQYAYNELGNRKMAIIYQNNDLGQGIKEALTQSFQRLGGEVVAAESYEVGAIDFRTQLSKIRDKKPDALYVASAGKDTALIVKQARELGIKSQFYSYHAFELPPDLMGIAGQAIEGAIYTSSSGKLPQEFINKWKQEFGEEPIFLQGSTYDSTYILAEGIKRAMEKGYGYTGEGLKKAILEIGEFNGMTGRFIIGEDGTAKKPVAIKKIVNRQFETIRVAEPK